MKLIPIKILDVITIVNSVINTPSSSSSSSSSSSTSSNSSSSSSSSSCIHYLGWGLSQNITPYVEDEIFINSIIKIVAKYEYILCLTNVEGGQVQFLSGYGCGFNCAIPITAMSNVIDIAAGWSHNIALKNDSTIVVWGYTDPSVGSPGEIPSYLINDNIIAIACGLYHSIVLDNKGSITAWGSNRHGECDITPHENNINFTAIAGGEFHTIALKDGAVYAWGRNNYGQLDIPPEAQSGVTAIASNGSHNLALKSDKSLVAWGNNDGGQCDIPSNIQNKVIAIACGILHNLVILENGQIVSWGSNSEHQTDQQDILGATNITAGFDFSAAIFPCASSLVKSTKPEINDNLCTCQYISSNGNYYCFPKNQVSTSEEVLSNMIKYRSLKECQLDNNFLETKPINDFKNISSTNSKWYYYNEIINYNYANFSNCDKSYRISKCYASSILLKTDLINPIEKNINQTCNVTVYRIPLNYFNNTNIIPFNKKITETTEMFFKNYRLENKECMFYDNLNNNYSYFSESYIMIDRNNSKGSVSTSRKVDFKIGFRNSDTSIPDIVYDYQYLPAIDKRNRNIVDKIMCMECGNNLYLTDYIKNYMSC